MRWIVAVLLAAIAVAAWAAHASWRAYLDEPINAGDQTVRYEVAAGTSLGAVALDLHARGWLRKPNWFVWYARSRGDEGRIRAGEYAIPAGTTPAGLLDLLVAGAVIQHSFTIIEGFTFADIRAQLATNANIGQTIAGLDDGSVMAALGQPGTAAEGQFLPETYHFTRGARDLDLLRRAHALMQETLTRLWSERDPDSPVKTPYEALILASIIEKETSLDSERPQVAGVFTRRLQRGMRLQSDPTVIYGLGANYDGDIKRRDLTGDTPYNTYTRAGLPPTPIAMPGVASIAAALHPAPGSTLYFVATGDPDGSHYFSETIDEHNRAVQRYLARLKKKP